MKGMDTARVEMVSPKGLDLQERVIEINRVAKVVKGGRRFSFTALVAVGDEESVVGIGYGKAREVPLAIQKAVDNARKNLVRIPKYGDTITHRIIGRFGAGHVVLRPASPGTGVIAGGGVRAVLELGGVRDVLTKSIGTQNPINLVKATMDGIVRLRRPEEVAELRDLSVNEVLGIDPEAKKEEGEAAEAASVEDADGGGEAAPAEDSDGRLSSESAGADSPSPGVPSESPAATAETAESAADSADGAEAEPATEAASEAPVEEVKEDGAPEVADDTPADVEAIEEKAEEESTDEKADEAASAAGADGGLSPESASAGSASPAAPSEPSTDTAGAAEKEES